MNKYLIKLANHLDKKSLHKEADYVDWILKKAQDIHEEEDFKYVSMLPLAKFKNQLENQISKLEDGEEKRILSGMKAIADELYDGFMHYEIERGLSITKSFPGFFKGIK